ncbi:MAG TPA: glycosyltransferase family 9 protein [Bryobacteraceae bacterium]|jgi:heptosyltransferase-1|nr:glycosyltransferase family 9 protein [Bryobacteraceae bacterium]
MKPEAILVIRLGAMGDILHALPAVSALKASFPRRPLLWLVASKWLPLLACHPDIDELIPFDRSGLHSFRRFRHTLRTLRPEIAIDFQGLVQSAILGRVARPQRFFGFDRSVAREPLASLLYSDPFPVTGPHRVERNIQLAQAAGASAVPSEIWLPPGNAEGEPFEEPYVLASPLAGWSSKQWPLERYDQLGARLRHEGLSLVLNVPPPQLTNLRIFENVVVQSTSLSGLIYSTRRAAAVLGVDSGPLHLAAALRKPGVALFGPTDPAQTGPYGASMTVLRDPQAQTTYKRGRELHTSMAALSVDAVFAALMKSMKAVSQTVVVAQTS